MRFRKMITMATVLVPLALVFVIQPPSIIWGAQEKPKQGNHATPQVGEIVSGAISGVVGALVGGIVGIAKSVFEVPQNRHQPSKTRKTR